MAAAGLAATASPARSQATADTVRTAREDPLPFPAPDARPDLYGHRQSIFINLPNTPRTHFEGELGPRFTFFQTLRRASDAAVRGSDSTFRAHGLAFAMVTRIRMTTESSAPVRTPSYMPRITYQHFRVRGLDPVGSRIRNASTIRVRTAELTVGHYSNGQDGCLFLDQVPTRVEGAKDEECLPAKAPGRTEQTVNRRDGSFSLHFLEGGFFQRRITTDRTLQMPGTLIGSSGYWSIGGRARYHVPSSWVGGGMAPELAEFYGDWRVNGEVDRVWRRGGNESTAAPGHVRVSVFSEYLGGARGVPSLRGSVEVSRVYYERSGWGWYGRVYSGQDYYNLGFLSRMTVLQLGVTLDWERLPAFDTPMGGEE